MCRAKVWTSGTRTISPCVWTISHAAECCIKNGYVLVRHHLDPKETTYPACCCACARRLASITSGLSTAFGTFSSVPPKLPEPASSLRSQNPDISGTLDGVL